MAKKIFEFKVTECSIGREKEGKAGNFIPFEGKSSKLNLPTAIYGKLSKKLLSLASKVAIEDLSTLGGYPVIITFEVFEPQEIKQEDIKNNVF